MNDSFLHFVLGAGGLFVGGAIRHFAEILIDKLFFWRKKKKIG